MRYEKPEALLQLAMTMQGTREGLTLQDIMERYVVSRRTAERMRDALERIFPQLEQANPGETPKRWRIPSGTLNSLVSFDAEELSAVDLACRVLEGKNMSAQSDAMKSVARKVKAMNRPEISRKVEPDLEALMEAEGLAMRPGPRPSVSHHILNNLRDAIKQCVKVRLHYRARTTGNLSRQIVCPYGFLYGSRHYLIAYSMNTQVRDYRLYSLSNIDAVDVTEWGFERREGFSIEDYAKRSFGVFQEEPFDVVWKFSPDVVGDVREYVFHPNQKMEEHEDGSLIVKFVAGGAREMCWHLFKWEGEVEILEPKRLRKMYRDMAKHMKQGT